MSIGVREAIARVDALVSEQGYAQSTLWQYRWAWWQVEKFCSQRGVAELTDEVVVSFCGFVASEHREGLIKEWKRKLLHRAVLVLSEVAKNGSLTGSSPFWGWCDSGRAL
jgi:site-specific recombinase XerC